MTKVDLKVISSHSPLCISPSQVILLYVSAWGPIFLVPYYMQKLQHFFIRNHISAPAEPVSPSWDPVWKWAWLLKAPMTYPKPLCPVLREKGRWSASSTWEKIGHCLARWNDCLSRWSCEAHCSGLRVMECQVTEGFWNSSIQLPLIQMRTLRARQLI